MSYHDVDAVAGRLEGMLLDETVSRWLWVVAIGAGVGGDLITTVVAIGLGAVEQNPVAVHLLDAFGIWILLPWKATGTVALYGFYRLLPPILSPSVPLALASCGVVATVWNLAVIVEGV